MGVNGIGTAGYPEWKGTRRTESNTKGDFSEGMSFAELAAAKAANKSDVSGISFKDMWQARYPGAYYHVMDGSAISQGAWDRNDFPLEKFFQDNTDASVLNWKPTGVDSEATSSQVQSRWNSTLGQKSIIVPPELEEKMKNDPELAKKVMANVENFVTTYTATSVRPGRVCSWLISLDENGEIEKYRVTGGGGNISGPTEEEQRQFEAEQAAKKKRREEYARLNEESALQNVMGVEALETEELQGFTLKTHSGTGIQYLVRDGEEGRGGKVLLQSKDDKEKYEALAATYFNKYPNLVHDKNAAYIWADLEIKGLAQHTNSGIVSVGYDGMSYNDNSNYKKNWSVLYSGDTYKAIFDWLQNNRGSIEEMQKFATWQDVFKNIGSSYERVWSDEEEKQGYLNN